MKDKLVFANVETLPAANLSAAHFVGDVKLGNRKDPAVVEKHILEESQKMWRRTSTSPFLAQVFVLTLLEEEGECEVVINTDERELMVALDNYIRLVKAELTPGQRICWHTFNGLSFDHPLLKLRGIKYKLPQVVQEMSVQSKWGDPWHVDWRQKLGDVGKLDDVARFFGINYPNPITGAQIWDTWVRGDRHAIKEHTMSRVLILRDLNRLVSDVNIEKPSEEEEAA